ELALSGGHASRLCRDVDGRRVCHQQSQRRPHVRLRPVVPHAGPRGRARGLLKPDDEAWMRLALEEARLAASSGDVPVGAVIVRDGAVIGRGRNRREQDNDPTAHAEVMAISQAAAVGGAWRLTGCTLYVTIEPCPMCAGALVLARIDRLVYGAADPKTGAAGSLWNIVQDERLNHRLAVTAGVLESECRELIRWFFRQRRQPKTERAVFGRRGCGAAERGALEMR